MLFSQFKKAVSLVFSIGLIMSLACSEKSPPPEDKVTGTVIRYDDVTSEFVKPRNVDVWLPADYETNLQKKYSVLYMHDGQNLFNPALSFIGVDWGIDETMTRLIEEGKIEPAIVVGVWNTDQRTQEYMPQKPVDDAKKEALDVLKSNYIVEAFSDNYLKFLVTELKPFIDSTYRTLPERENTFVMGSSMGGLISLYAVCEYPEVFGGAGCISTHWPINNGIVLDYMDKSLPEPGNNKIYFDHGNKTLDAKYPPFQEKADEIMKRHNFTADVDWMTRFFDGHEHSERAWKQRVHIPIEFFLGVK